MNEAVKNNCSIEPKREIKFSRLSQEDIDSVISQLGPYDEMTIEECQAMTAKMLGKNGLSSAIIEMRREGR